MTWIYDIATALALLTRLPLRARFDRTSRAAWAWPVAGFVVGGFTVLVAWVCLALGVPAFAVAGLVLAVQIIVTGAMHEDGLADCADGFWGGFDRARRLEIMRDPHLGTYGAIALILSIGLRWAALTAIAAGGGIAEALLSAAILSRAPMLALATALPHARDDGLSVATGRPPQAAMWIGLAFCLPVALVSGITVILVASLAGLTCALIARTKIDGQTGDVLGATQQITEIAVLMTLATIAT